MAPRCKGKGVMISRFCVLVGFVLSLGFSLGPVQADESPIVTSQNQARFQQWLKTYEKQAINSGISEATLKSALDGLTLSEQVLSANAFQPEFSKPVWKYIEGAVTTQRIEKGQALLVQHSALFDELEAQYGVQSRFIVAIWAMETNFGSFMGNHQIVQALATLGFEGRRKSYGRTQLMAALQILDNGDRALEEFTGSWAGAMGHTQFIPTTFLTYAVDQNSDGKRDIWDSLPDALASTANYLKSSGWTPQQDWGSEVKLPEDFDYSEAGRKNIRTLSTWRARGVTFVDGMLIPEMDRQGSIVIPAGHQGPAFLVFGNFRSILRYNNSTAYALAVGHLADRLAKGSAFTQTWPKHLTPLSRAQRFDLQSQLNKNGYSVGTVDGIIGARTSAALRKFQLQHGLIPDGFPTTDLLAILQQETSKLDAAPSSAE